MVFLEPKKAIKIKSQQDRSLTEESTVGLFFLTTSLDKIHFAFSTSEPDKNLTLLMNSAENLKISQRPASFLQVQRFNTFRLLRNPYFINVAWLVFICSLAMTIGFLCFIPQFFSYILATIFLSTREQNAL